MVDRRLQIILPFIAVTLIVSWVWFSCFFFTLSSLTLYEFITTPNKYQHHVTLWPTLLDSQPRYQILSGDASIPSFTYSDLKQISVSVVLFIPDTERNRANPTFTVSSTVFTSLTKITVVKGARMARVKFKHKRKPKRSLPSVWRLITALPRALLTFIVGDTIFGCADDDDDDDDDNVVKINVIDKLETSSIRRNLNKSNIRSAQISKYDVFVGVEIDTGFERALQVGAALVEVKVWRKLAVIRVIQRIGLTNISGITSLLCSTIFIGFLSFGMLCYFIYQAGRQYMPSATYH